MKNIGEAEAAVVGEFLGSVADQPVGFVLVAVDPRTAGQVPAVVLSNLLPESAARLFRDAAKHRSIRAFLGEAVQ